MKKIEYVASAFINYLRLKIVHSEFKDEMWPVLQNMINRVENRYAPNMSVAFLYNSFTESDIGDKTRDLGKNTYADSGGLQMVTTKAGEAKKHKMEEEKLKVYANQAEFADFGFTFDEIPAMVINEGAFGIGGSVIVKELCEPYGEKAGKNLLDQYNTFVKTDTKCKMIPIIQGADTETTDLYSQGLFKQMPEGFEDKCRGIALGGINTSNIFAPTFLMHSTMQVQNESLRKIMKQGIHLLGVGSLSKILGILILMENDLLDIDILTIDSASISKSYHYGSIRLIEPNGKMKTYNTGKQLTPTITKIYSQIWEFFKDDLTPLFDDYDDFMSKSIYDKEFMSVPNKERDRRDRARWYIHICAYALFDLHNIMHTINEVVYNKVPFDKVISLRPNDSHIFKHLETCNTHEKLDAWVKQQQSSGLDNKPVVDTVAEVERMTKPTVDDWL